MVHDLLEDFEDAARILVRHDGNDADQRAKAKASVIAAAAARAPCGLCAASSTTAGERRTSSNLPGKRTWANPSRTTSGCSALSPRNASAAASAWAAFAAWCAP